MRLLPFLTLLSKCWITEQGFLSQGRKVFLRQKNSLPTKRALPSTFSIAPGTRIGGTETSALTLVQPP